eukprot:6491509-Amphidinium_carterae.2
MEALPPEFRQALQQTIEQQVAERVNERLSQQAPLATSASLRIVDTKVGRPPDFTGDATKLDEFSFKFEAYAAALDPRLGAALEKVKLALDTPVPLSDQNRDERALSSQVYFALAMVSKDAALQQVRLAESANGFEAWRLLLKRYQPRSRATGLSKLSKIVAPQFDHTNYLDSLATWERQIQEYEMQTKDVVSDTVKSAVLAAHAPPDAQTYLYMHANNQDYRVLKNLVEEFMVAKQVQMATPSPMEVDAVGWKGDKGGKGGGKGAKQGAGKGKKGQDKGKGDKGKGKAGHQQQQSQQSHQPSPPNQKRFEGYCRHCGKYGHKVADCRLKKQPVMAVSDEQGMVSQSTNPVVPSSSLSLAQTQLVGGVWTQTRPALPKSADDQQWVCMVRASEEGKTPMRTREVMLDSGAVISVCGTCDFLDIPLQ